MSGVDELAGLPIGRRIQIIRERRGKTRAVVAGLVGRSDEWLKAVERGRMHPPRLDMLVRLGEALGVTDLAELTGEQALNLGIGRRAGHEAVPAMREAIEEMPLAVSGAPAPSPADLERRVADAWHLWHTSSTPRASVGAVLPGLIREGRRAVRVLDGLPRRQAHAALSAAYALAEQVLAWVSDSALLWLVADRCMASAEQADEPDTLAGAAWVVGNVWRSTGREEDAYTLANDAADLLSPRLADGTDDSRALWGAVRLHASITAARLGREGDALRQLDQADEMTHRLPTGYTHPWTLFGRANTDLTGVNVRVDLRQTGSALDHAGNLDLDEIPSVDRRARLWLETARAYSQRNDHTGALHTLQRATEVCAESMRSHPMARGLAGELVTSGGRMVEREARALAGTLGVTV
ncbi:MAG TPA: helix-turn-helix transcriptional regulator [Pseudonocardiaceae bacterium]|jgi:transcriptional regulator with XRE-family HTH domain|nr:helix-turn-helix transcriptional regulator [Pseudonocardiaceae bacterium]